MSWDEDFKNPSVNEASVADDWEQEAVEDEDANDQPLLESWDVDIDELEKKKKEEAAKKKAEIEALKKRQQEALANKKNKKGKKPVLLEIDKVDGSTRRKMLKEAQLKADIKNAAELFAGMELSEKKKGEDSNGTSNEEDLDELFEADDDDEQTGSRVALTVDSPLIEHPLFLAEDEQGYEKLRRGLAGEMKRLAKVKPLTYVNSLAIDLISTMCEPMSLEQTRKVVSTLNAQVTKKVKDERKIRLSKTGGTSLGGTGKKKVKGKLNIGGGDSFRTDKINDMLEDDDDDFGDEDFM
ncbi:hypothetical protein FOA43_003065 [Brettanomyces nanus]|uniref:Eukaryotic translation initiation factor 3 30 kDa subunit n=1 Tax=Eeniella nana TaxID=13502 RepID=A0A875S2Y8_EENNA|nr:uncharacterized protein FOA43_003065 [Brettanomyces nanus]QPG75706.1 hypothetical protein FOA43_003065 [Brettanomyces nanus]